MIPKPQKHKSRRKKAVEIPQIKESIMQTEKKCYITGRIDNLHQHHIYFGKNREISDKYGFWVWLTGEYHNQDSRKDVHHNRSFDLQLKEDCQRKFEQTYTREQFRKLIGKSYL